MLEVVDAGKLIPSTLEETYLNVWDTWNSAEESFFFFDGEIPEPTPEMLARGKEIYNDATAGNCASCHGESGQGTDLRRS